MEGGVTMGEYTEVGQTWARKVNEQATVPPPEAVKAFLLATLTKGLHVQATAVGC